MIPRGLLHELTKHRQGHATLGINLVRMNRIVVFPHQYHISVRCYVRPQLPTLSNPQARCASALKVTNIGRRNPGSQRETWVTPYPPGGCPAIAFWWQEVSDKPSVIVKVYRHHKVSDHPILSIVNPNGQSHSNVILIRPRPVSCFTSPLEFWGSNAGRQPSLLAPV